MDLNDWWVSLRTCQSHVMALCLAASLLCAPACRAAACLEAGWSVLLSPLMRLGEWISSQYLWLAVLRICALLCGSARRDGQPETALEGIFC